MGYKSDFESADGWNVVDTNSRVIGSAGRLFKTYLKERGVTCLVRYYASTARPKTLTRQEASELVDDGFHILPVFQDRNREPEDFGKAKGRANGRSARAFANEVRQPAGSTILFAVDSDLSANTVRDLVLPYFEGVNEEIGNDFKIGAYSSGYTLDALLDEELISVPWLSMSRGFAGTKEFFYANRWKLRQIPPDKIHTESGFSFDRNLLRVSLAEVGAFQTLQAAIAHSSTANSMATLDAHLGSSLVAGNVPLGTSASHPPVATSSPFPTNMYVKTEGLNLRNSPEGAIVAALTLADPVHVYGTWVPDGWNKVNVQGREGYVFGKYLRPPLADDVEALVQKAVAEWVRFRKGLGDEKVAPYRGYVGEMWHSINLPHDGSSVDENGDEIAWSAAFISFVVRKASPAYRNFAFHQAHAFYANDAIQARIRGLIQKPFWGYRINEVKPMIGDIIFRNRIPGSSNFSFDYAENHTQYKSHADFVVEVTEDVVRVLGGNVGDTVSMISEYAGDNLQEYNLDANGYLAGGQKIIAILKNRVVEIP